MTLVEEKEQLNEQLRENDDRLRNRKRFFLKEMDKNLKVYFGKMNNTKIFKNKEGNYKLRNKKLLLISSLLGVI